ncbi:1,2-phenylacetyl-CoA epoxidase subunit PaaD [Caldalkalibacillus salinus]|uniref:1,2-phenylacetyl-CoA epoxidase subunit PaaD n=1 Tax=Caldalkalibacillus salinus TaxID=2803787 RepID=UPI003017D38A
MNVEQEIWRWLEEVKDPEIPSVSVVDMGMVKSVYVTEVGRVQLDMIPTFVGCPALNLIEKEVKNTLQSKPGIKDVTVTFVMDIPWTSDRINEQGRQNLKKYGIAPPPKDYQEGDPWVAECPYCSSPKTVMENVFGPTACRSILYCTTCKNPFEAIKPV